MDSFRVERIVPKSRTITINKLPFRSGEKVQVVVKSQKRTSLSQSTASAILKHAGKWVGKDLEQRLGEVYATRALAEF